MADLSANVKAPTEASGSVVLPFAACTAADKFAASTGRYLLIYTNGATATGTVFVNEQKAVAPTGATPAAPAGATKWSDLKVGTTIPASGTYPISIADISKYVDVTGFVNLQHAGTLTTLTLGILGPY